MCQAACESLAESFVPRTPSCLTLPIPETACLVSMCIRSIDCLCTACLCFALQDCTAVHATSQSLVALESGFNKCSYFQYQPKSYFNTNSHPFSNQSHKHVQKLSRSMECQQLQLKSCAIVLAVAYCAAWSKPQIEMLCARVHCQMDTSAT
jgi:hypothetical protein